MQERDLLRQAIAPCLPDPEQVRQNILRECAPKARRKSLRTYLPAAACIALLLTAAVLFSTVEPAPKSPRRGRNATPYARCGGAGDAAPNACRCAQSAF